MTQVVGSSKIQELKTELFPNEGAKFTPISDRSKQSMNEQSNVEAFEMLELSNKDQCEHSLKYVPSGHEYFGCGREVVSSNQNPVIFEQLQLKICQKFELQTTTLILRHAVFSYHKPLVHPLGALLPCQTG